MIEQRHLIEVRQKPILLVKPDDDDDDDNEIL